MNGNCHFVFGAVCGSMIAVNLDKLVDMLPNISSTPAMGTLFVLGGLVGGIMPDIDNPVSHIGRLTAPLSNLIGKAGAAFGKSGKMHRGILHDPFFYMVGLVLSYLYFPPLVGLFTGSLSHIFLDMFNPSGVPFMFGIKRLHLGQISSGSKQSILFTWAASSVVLLAGLLVKVGLIL